MRHYLYVLAAVIMLGLGAAFYAAECKLATIVALFGGVVMIGLFERAEIRAEKLQKAASGK